MAHGGLSVSGKESNKSKEEKRRDLREYRERRNAAMKSGQGRRRALLAISAIALLAAGALAAYPLLSDYTAARDAAEVVTQAAQTAESAAPEEVTEARAQAQAYNREIASGVAAGAGRRPSYEELLNLGGNGVMGALEIPKINLTLPILHGVAGETLERGVGHLPGSSLPVGGASTHAVLTGHTGMAGQRMFTDLDRLAVGDRFQLHILSETLTYEVDRILVVLPEETDEALAVVLGADYVTLVTCTPYGVNTHRLLVRGVRVETETARNTASVTDATIDTGEIAAPSTWRREYLKGCAAGLVAAGLILGVVWLIWRLWRRRRKTRPPDDRQSGS